MVRNVNGDKSSSPCGYFILVHKRRLSPQTDYFACTLSRSDVRLSFAVKSFGSNKVIFILYVLLLSLTCTRTHTHTHTHTLTHTYTHTYTHTHCHTHTVTQTHTHTHTHTHRKACGSTFRYEEDDLADATQNGSKESRSAEGLEGE